MNQRITVEQLNELTDEQKRSCGNSGTAIIQKTTNSPSSPSGRCWDLINSKSRINNYIHYVDDARTSSFNNISGVILNTEKDELVDALGKLLRQYYKSPTSQTDSL